LANATRPLGNNTNTNATAPLQGLLGNLTGSLAGATRPPTGTDGKPLTPPSSGAAAAAPGALAAAALLAAMLL
jgi:hypothetical protein